MATAGSEPEPKPQLRARSPVIRPGFNLELHVDNKGIDRTCKEEITVTVFYGDMVVGWADVPDFCVDKRSTADVNLKLSHADVLLTDTLRRRLASGCDPRSWSLTWR
ncbi:hypothetical protein ZWY2020_020462 [Hordeum vulgare]|nr:hypothetical protein ZWY2020_020462 [Hordeum vulgare]